MKTILCITAALAMGIASASAATLAQQADSAYMAEDYARAADLYSRSIAEEGPAADTWYNLGNAHWRQGHAGQAIIGYERALRIDPSHADARTNLDFVRTKIQDLPEDDSAFLSTLRGSRLDEARRVGLDGIRALPGRGRHGRALHLRTRRDSPQDGLLRRHRAAVPLHLRHCGGLATGCAVDRHDHAVVTVPTTLLSSTPKASQSATDKVVAIHEGTKVEIVDSVMAPGAEGAEQWYDVKINNSTRAWLKAKDVERI